MGQSWSLGYCQNKCQDIQKKGSSGVFCSFQFWGPVQTFAKDELKESFPKLETFQEPSSRDYLDTVLWAV